MPPKKKEQQQKMSLGDFLTDSGFGGGSWADEVEETVFTGTQVLPPSDRPGASRFGGGGSSSWADRGYSTRDPGPQTLPDKPPFTAHVGNLSYDATVESVTDFFSACNVANVRIIEDREAQRPKGFGYVEFGDLEGLKKALNLDGDSFEGRMMKIKIADPPRGGDSGRGDFIRDMGDWTRKGPLEPLAQRGGGGRSGPDFSERRAPRDPAVEGKAARDLTWERRGPLPAPTEDPAREGGRQRPAPEGMGERSDSSRGSRRQAPAWGEGRTEGSRPPRKEYQERPERPERPERTPTAADMDNKWRDSMRPAAPVASESPKGSAPSSPSATAAAPAAAASRPKLNLAKRTVSEAPTDAASASGDAKASPFGAARPINTAAREKEIEEKRQQAVQEKKEADDKAKEDRRLAKEAAAKAEEEAKAAQAKAEAEAPAAEEKTEEPKTEDTETAEKAQNGAAEQKAPIRNREPREPREPRTDAPKPRGTEGGNWRSEGRPRGGQAGGRGGRGGAPRGPRNDREQRDNRNSRNGPTPSQQQAPASPTEPETPTQDEDGWTTVPLAKKGRPGRPVA